MSVLSQDQIDDLSPFAPPAGFPACAVMTLVCARLREEFERGDGESGQSDHNTS